jgi:hypothetical protein
METEVEDRVIISWSNVGQYCRVVFFFGLPEDEQTKDKKSDMKMLQRKLPWEPEDMYGIPLHKEGNLKDEFIEKDKARKLWTRLQEEHGFYLNEETE